MHAEALANARKLSLITDKQGLQSPETFGLFDRLSELDLELGRLAQAYTAVPKPKGNKRAFAQLGEIYTPPHERRLLGLETTWTPPPSLLRWARPLEGYFDQLDRVRVHLIQSREACQWAAVELDSSTAPLIETTTAKIETALAKLGGLIVTNPLEDPNGPLHPFTIPDYLARLAHHRSVLQGWISDLRTSARRAGAGFTGSHALGRLAPDDAGSLATLGREFESLKDRVGVVRSVLIVHERGAAPAWSKIITTGPEGYRYDGKTYAGLGECWGISTKALHYGRGGEYPVQGPSLTILAMCEPGARATALKAMGEYRALAADAWKKIPPEIRNRAAYLPWLDPASLHEPHMAWTAYLHAVAWHTGGRTVASAIRRTHKSAQHSFGVGTLLDRATYPPPALAAGSHPHTDAGPCHLDIRSDDAADFIKHGYQWPLAWFESVLGSDLFTASKMVIDRLAPQATGTAAISQGRDVKGVDAVETIDLRPGPKRALATMYQLRAFDFGSRKSVTDVAKKAIVRHRTMQDHLAVLKKAELYDSAIGPTGGIWLSAKGRRYYETELMPQERTV
jgi:hypothetical protein